MKEENTHDRIPIYATESRRLPFGKEYQSQYQNKKSQQDRGRTYKPLFLSHRTENEVGILLRDVFQFGLRSVQKAFPCQSAGTDSNLGLVYIVAGTGSVAYGQDSAGNASRVGGWSLFFADEGSCSWVARQLITEFVKQSDGRRPRSAIYEEVRSALGITKDLYVSGYLQTDVRNNSALLAQLQPVALRAARRGDTSALDIYRRAAAELAETAVAIRCKLDFPVEVPVRVSYSGGLFHAGEIILQPFRKEMEQNGFTIEPPLYSPVIGATALAAERFISPAALDDLLANAAQAL